QHVKDTAKLPDGFLFQNCRVLMKFCDPTFEHIATVHCEAGLATLAKYPDLVVGSNHMDATAMRDLLKVQSPRPYLFAHLTSFSEDGHEVDICLEVMLSRVLGPIGNLEERELKSGRG